MKNLYSLMLLGLCLFATVSSAQDTCRVYSIPNPHGAAMSVTRVWVVDSVNFSVESVNPLPHQMTATSTFDIRVCIRARDGQSHSTIVRYSNTHGTSSYPVTMTAPATSGVETGIMRNLGLPPALPNPSGTTVSIDPGYTLPHRLRTEIVDLSGQLLRVDERPVIVDGRILVDVNTLANGRYLVRVVTPGRRVGSWQIVVQH